MPNRAIFFNWIKAMMHSIANPIFKIHAVGETSDLFKSRKILSLAFFIYFLFFSLGYISEAASNLSMRSEGLKMYSKMNNPLQFLAASIWGSKRKH